MNIVRCFICTGVLLLASADVGGQGKKPNRAGFDDATVLAYEKLGATCGCMANFWSFEPRAAATASELPAFCFPGGPPAPLSDPGTPFGMHAGYYAQNCLPTPGPLSRMPGGRTPLPTRR